MERQAIIKPLNPGHAYRAMGEADRKPLVDRSRFAFFVVLFEIVFIAVFIGVSEYDPETVGPRPKSLKGERDGGFTRLYPQFQDVHVMIFIGFGFLMTFLRRYGMGAVGLNLILACLSIQWALLTNGFFHMAPEEDPCQQFGGTTELAVNPNSSANTIKLGLVSMLKADFTSAAILISFGAVIGVASPLQLVIMVIIETALMSINEYIGIDLIKAVDAGDSIFVHLFGAYYGLAVSWVLCKCARGRNEWNSLEAGHSKEGADYKSDIFSMIGTVFLWCFWPSFNAATSTGMDGQRVVFNTYVSLVTCVLVTAALSSFVHEEGKLDPVHIQNSTLAGGVAVGTMGNMMLGPGGAMGVGAAAAVISVLGFKFVTPWLLEKFDVHDTCGVHNLHGMPAVLAAVGSIFGCLMATEERYQGSLHTVFPSMQPEPTAALCAAGQKDFGSGFDKEQQAARQAAALFATLGIALLGGVITGFILNIPLFQRSAESHLFEDFFSWEVEPEKVGRILWEEEQGVTKPKTDYGAIPGDDKTSLSQAEAP